MKILCHRGYWKEPAEKNTAAAFRRGFALGLGTETDIRDFNGSLVVSHDPPRSNVMTFAQLLEMTPRNALLALNVKSDGIAQMAIDQLKAANHREYVFFDMSIPDMRSYLQIGAPVAARLSEFEPWVDVLMSQVNTIWLDAFEGNWYDVAYLKHLLQMGKQILLVSSELHGRSGAELEAQWAIFDTLVKSTNSDKLLLCTDYPELALKRFC